MITQRHIEHDGDRVLWRVAIDDVVALDVLTDRSRIARARAAIATDLPEAVVEEQLGSFGPFAVTVSVTAGHPDQAFISVDGPELGSAFLGDQSIVFYLDRQDLVDALTVD
jgi:hypothetical protein